MMEINVYRDDQTSDPTSMMLNELLRLCKVDFIGDTNPNPQS